MQGGDANVVNIELQAAEATWSGDANVVFVQIHGGHGLRRAVGHELCHGGRAKLLHEHDQCDEVADRGCHSLREGEAVSARGDITCYDSTGGGYVVVCN